MVLQRDSKTKVWGWASPQEKVELRFKNNTFKTIADKNGNWSFELKPQKAGGPFEMIFKGKNEIKVDNILFGDVWICSGQSNMVTPMERVKEKYPEEVATANFDEIRNFFISTTNNLQGPQEDLPKGQWKPAIKEHIMEMGAVSYFFAKKIYTKYGVPIGIINASVGGTPIQSWISESGFKEFPKDLVKIQKNKDTSYTNQFTVTSPSTNQKPQIKDKGLLAKLKWYEEGLDTKDWNKYYIPGFWEDQGLRNLNGVVWFRREIEIPDELVGVEAKLFMGRIVDADEVYVNGTKIGNITYQYPPRRYTVPKGVLKKGKNTVVVRVTNSRGKGGFVPDKNYELTAKGISIDLKGEWKYKVGEVFVPKRSNGTYTMFSAQNQPTSLYNAMISPLTPLAVKGFLWYQGESNSGNPKGYGDYLKALMADFRTQFNVPNAPFLYVQLANFQDVDYLPTESKWAELRFEQFQGLSEPNTAMAVAIDLGEWNDIHPLNKKDVGERLALGALKLAYGENIVHSGPIYKSSEILQGKIVLHFESTGSGLIAIDGKPLHRFEIAGEDQKFIWADAVIEGNTVVVKNEGIPHPKYVRYAWADNPMGANLYNKEGLPASPFRNYAPEALNALPWQGKKAAVVLTYDDALNVHLDNAVPILDSLGLKGTFYISTYSEAFRNRLQDWKRITKTGHELANHTIFHPCIGKESRPWVNPNYDMASYTVKRMVDEIKINNTLLEALDGKKERTFAYTCGDFTVNGNDFFIDELKNELLAARAVRSEMHTIDQIDLYSMDSYPIIGESGAEMIAMVKKAVETNSLLILLFHGVGGEHSMDVSLPAHKELLEYLKQHENEVWTAPLIDVAKNIKQYRASTATD
ncbi:MULTISPECIES: sialate O-acetylesterase [Flavobacteriaceae]|uniref:sialate O-acetylesterase n=1 Tax=Flavobacteriaceae TaxID=49546 RepID=UPI001FEB2B33|nr:MULTISPECIES: sialate O-acetylesterase [Allomuricauda]MDC6366196.1 sialate O-acetylesterase [Muricauda sp. AC10]